MAAPTYVTDVLPFLFDDVIAQSDQFHAKVRPHHKPVGLQLSQNFARCVDRNRKSDAFACIEWT